MENTTTVYEDFEEELDNEYGQEEEIEELDPEDRFEEHILPTIEDRMEAMGFEYQGHGCFLRTYDKGNGLWYTIFVSAYQDWNIWSGRIWIYSPEQFDAQFDNSSNNCFKMDLEPAFTSSDPVEVAHFTLGWLDRALRSMLRQISG